MQKSLYIFETPFKDKNLYYQQKQKLGARNDYCKKKLENPLYLDEEKCIFMCRRNLEPQINKAINESRVKYNQQPNVHNKERFLNSMREKCQFKFERKLIL